MHPPHRAPRFRLTYTSASFSTRASSDLPTPETSKPRRLRLRPSPNPPHSPLPQRSVTTLGDAPDLSRTQLYHQRALSAISHPPPHATAHIQPPIPASATSLARYPDSHPAPHSAATATAANVQRPASRGHSLPHGLNLDIPPREDPTHPLRRTRSAHKQKSPFPYPRSRLPKVRQPSSSSSTYPTAAIVQLHRERERERDRPPSRALSGPRAVYNATTASAKAAALSASKPRLGYLVQPRDRNVATRTHEEESTDLSSIHLSRDDSSYTLAADRARRLEAAKLHNANLHPDQKRPATRIVVKRRVIRGSSSWRLATEDDIDEYLQGERHREMVKCPLADVDVKPQPLVQDEITDVDPLCSNCSCHISPKKSTAKRGVRRVSSLLSKHLRLEAENTLDITEMAAMDEYKAVAMFLAEIRKYRKEMYYGLRDKSMDRTSEQRQSGSGKKREMRKNTKEKKYAKDLEKFHRAMTEQRSMSADDPAIMRALMRQDQFHALVAATRKRVGQRPSDPLKNEAVIAMQDNPKYDKERSQSELDLRQKMIHPGARTRVASCLAGSGRFDSLKSESSENGQGVGVNDFDEEDEYSNNRLRILTAMEPVDPSIGFEDSDAQRGTSYHMEFSTHGVAGGRRRAHRNSGDSSILRRFRSLRRRAEDRY